MVQQRTQWRPTCCPYHDQTIFQPLVPNPILFACLVFDALLRMLSTIAKVFVLCQANRYGCNSYNITFFFCTFCISKNIAFEVELICVQHMYLFWIKGCLIKILMIYDFSQFQDGFGCGAFSPTWTYVCCSTLDKLEAGNWSPKPDLWFFPPGEGSTAKNVDPSAAFPVLLPWPGYKNSSSSTSNPGSTSKPSAFLSGIICFSIG